MDFNSLVNIGLCGAVIVIIQVIKGIVDKENKVNPDVWTFIVLLSGFPCATIMNFIDGWGSGDVIQIIFEFIVKSFIYSASCSLLYKTGKMSLLAILGKDEKNGTDK